MFHILHKLCVTVPKKVLLTEKGPRLRYPWSHNHCRTVGASDPSHPTLVQHAIFFWPDPFSNALANIGTNKQNLLQNTHNTVYSINIL